MITPRPFATKSFSKSRRISIAAVATAPTYFLTGCGGGGDEASPSRTPNQSASRLQVIDLQNRTGYVSGALSLGNGEFMTYIDRGEPGTVFHQSIMNYVNKDIDLEVTQKANELTFTDRVSGRSGVINSSSGSSLYMSLSERGKPTQIIQLFGNPLTGWRWSLKQGIAAGPNVPPPTEYAISGDFSKTLNAIMTDTTKVRATRSFIDLFLGTAYAQSNSASSTRRMMSGAMIGTMGAIMMLAGIPALVPLGAAVAAIGAVKIGRALVEYQQNKMNEFSNSFDVFAGIGTASSYETGEFYGESFSPSSSFADRLRGGLRSIGERGVQTLNALPRPDIQNVRNAADSIWSKSVAFVDQQIKTFRPQPAPPAQCIPVPGNDFGCRYE